MSVEFMLVATSSVEQTVREKAILCLESKEIFSVVERQFTCKKSTCSFSFRETKREKWPEDFTVSIGQKEVYLAFHSSTRQQENYVVGLLIKCLHDVGISGSFEEL